MDLKGLPGGQYKPLSEKDIKTIHEAALAILEKTGFTYESGLEDTLAMLEAAGARVDRTAARVRFPRKLVLEHIGKAPQQVVLYSRTGKDDLDLTEHHVYLGTSLAKIGEEKQTALILAVKDPASFQEASSVFKKVLRIPNVPLGRIIR